VVVRRYGRVLQKVETPFNIDILYLGFFFSGFRSKNCWENVSALTYLYESKSRFSIKYCIPYRIPSLHTISSQYHILSSIHTLISTFIHSSPYYLSSYTILIILYYTTLTLHYTTIPYYTTILTTYTLSLLPSISYPILLLYTTLLLPSYTTMPHTYTPIPHTMSTQRPYPIPHLCLVLDAFVA